MLRYVEELEEELEVLQFIGWRFWQPKLFFLKLFKNVLKSFSG